MRRFPLSRAIQWLMTIGSALLIIRVVDLRALPGIIASAHPAHLALALVIALAHFFAGAWRWQQLMLLYGARDVRYARLCKLYLAAFFVSSILPGTISGDGLRVYGTRQEVGGATAALVIVMLERLIGLGLLALTGAIAWAMLPGHPLLQLALPHPAYGLLLLAGAGGLVALGAFVRRDLFGKAVAWMGRLLQLSLQLPGLVRSSPRRGANVLLGSLVYQALSVMIIYEALRATGVPISLQVFLAVVPVVTLLLILPISVQGIGVRESLYLVFLVPYGLQPEPILAGLALTYIIGVPFMLWGWALFHGLYRDQLGVHQPQPIAKANDTL